MIFDLTDAETKRHQDGKVIGGQGGSMNLVQSVDLFPLDGRRGQEFAGVSGWLPKGKTTVVCPGLVNMGKEDKC